MSDPRQDKTGRPEAGTATTGDPLIGWYDDPYSDDSWEPDATSTDDPNYYGQGERP